MAGYSGTPLPNKLGIKPGAVAVALHAPKDFAALLEPLPESATLRSTLPKLPADVIVLFCKNKSVLTKDFARARAAMAQNAGLWIAWPKKSSGVATDLTEDFVRAWSLEHDLVDNKVCAIDDTWSGLRVVIPLAKRK